MQNRSQAPPTFSFALLYLHNVVWILLLLPYSNAKLKKKPELVEVITLLEKKCKNKYSSVFSSFFFNFNDTNCSSEVRMAQEYLHTFSLLKSKIFISIYPFVNFFASFDILFDKIIPVLSNDFKAC